RSLRRIVSTNSWFYRWCAAAVDFSMITARCGLKNYFFLLKTRRAKAAGGRPLQMHFDNLMHPLSIRPGTDDVRTVIDNVIREEWGNFSAEREPQFMIDGGAYIGDSSAYFLSRFPDLKVVALEPDPITF